ncbi:MULTISPECIES: UDP-2-acetamido-2,6-beta-L-arabino-hexul-4-ose reductase [Pseudidiomarina]|uniref:UDP-2-acetamido-2,6-beta-L-arabino-hexul-4-ose reductase n=2 Tax=Pseudidiomarina TaxID=2800384 RepID=A0A368ULJ7_9GAMM|nr:MULTISPECIES: NAD-dependent epimerase/dehydratase family protein [Pseudidiomarina]PWW06861.1 UDP-2-acetamido-2,6-beta-L-arabino-hexul-4-ose reductase [Pseudidiomarina maritima]RBP86603.1 UDP-2-acetamido-2,6-beta-L-arabino-hexul-4-ose reductase [Pseudidiomarina tainanensis]RCW28880.1 UDP-2-acetamido-2,6-beta-L-arabino-hexul-4-ose reductase [Pseudidiomarina tainanensis]
MKLLVTGANGFVGKNLLVHLQEMPDVDVVAYTRSNTVDELPELLKGVDAVIHLAGINRPQDDSEFVKGNTDLTQCLADALEALAKHHGKRIPVLYSSSIQAERNNPYGLSKKAAEDALLQLEQNTGISVYIYRLANVFGKWCKPNYNSMVATFCHNIIRDIPIEIHNEDAEVKLVYVDDVVQSLITTARQAVNATQNNEELPKTGFVEANPVYTETVGSIAKQLKAFKHSRETLISERVGTGFTRKLYSTYVSYLPTDAFTYTVPKYVDERGVFVEMLKTPDAGQFSYFTAHPGITRGGHYHHTKTEKFLVIKGKACFKFRHMVTGEFYELFTEGESPEIVETVPGWSHDITNVGDDEMVVMLWANEIFDRENPDTYACPVVKPHSN